MPDQPDPKHDRPRLTRRDALAGAAVAGLGLVALRASGRHPSSGVGHVEVGNMALDELYQVSRKEWIGPGTLRGDVPKEPGNVFKAVDEQIEYYYDGTEWDPFGVEVRSSEPPAPEQGARVYYREDLSPPELRAKNPDGIVETLASFVL